MRKQSNFQVIKETTKKKKVSPTGISVDMHGETKLHPPEEFFFQEKQ